jgi:uncharacterized YigZ family protein
MDSYLTVEENNTAEYREKGSKFIACVFPASSEDVCKKQLELIKKQHTKANHHCFAYKLRQDTRKRYNDDGEPSGTAGRPILGVIEKYNLVDVHLVVVRYFGGTKLGVRGLIDAYSGAAAQAVESANLNNQKILKELKVISEYPALGFIERFILQNKLEVLNATYGHVVEKTLGIAPSKYEKIKIKLEEKIKEEFGSLIQTPYPVKIKP